MQKQVACVMPAACRISTEEREKRIFAKYCQEPSGLDRLSDWELSARYVETKAKLEYKKNAFSFFLIAILVSALTNIWQTFYNLTEKALQIALSAQAESEALAQVNFFIFAIVATMLTVSILIGLFSWLRELSRLHKKLLLIEEVRHGREK